MITIKEWMELVNYRITEGSDFYSYEGKCYILSSWNGEQNGFSSDIIFNTEDQTVFSVQLHDYKNNLAYRLTNPNYTGEKEDSCAWDDVDYVELESDDDYMQKHLAVFQVNIFK